MTGRLVRESLLAAFVGLLAGVTLHFVADNDRAAGQAPATMARAELEDLLSRSLVRTDVVACEVRRQGTTTILDTSDGAVLLTNAHVVQGAASATLSGARLGVREAWVDGFVAGRDVAALELADGAVGGGHGLEVGPAPERGDGVFVAGFPGGHWTVRAGTVDSIEPRSGWGTTSDVLVVDVPVEQGSSGGVVVDAQGRAVGLVAARDPGSGYAVAYPVADLLAAEPGPAPGC